jgi:hypothetical protein
MNLIDKYGWNDVMVPYNSGIINKSNEISNVLNKYNCPEHINIMIESYLSISDLMILSGAPKMIKAGDIDNYDNEADWKWYTPNNANIISYDDLSNFEKKRLASDPILEMIYKYRYTKNAKTISFVSNEIKKISYESDYIVTNYWNTDRFD